MTTPINLTITLTLDQFRAALNANDPDVFPEITSGEMYRFVRIIPRNSNGGTVIKPGEKFYLHC